MKNQTPSCPSCGKPCEVPGEKFSTEVLCPHCNQAFNPMSVLMKEGMKWFEQQVAEDTASVSHTQFVAGLKDGTLKVTPFKGNGYALIRGESSKFFFSLTVMFYLIAPLLVVPLLSWRSGNPWLLFGILASWAASFITRRLGLEPRQYTFGGWTFFAALAAWIFLGRHSYWTIFLTCGVCGSFFYMIAEETQQTFVKESLIKDAALFDWAVSEQRIWILKKPPKP